VWGISIDGANLQRLIIDVSSRRESESEMMMMLMTGERSLGESGR
jgi:hypothetical protein